jgi:hypothetical protein
MTTAQAPTSKRVALYFLSLSLVVLICAIHLLFPFRGDQALFATAAIEISEGGGLYTTSGTSSSQGIFLFLLVVWKGSGNVAQRLGARILPRRAMGRARKSTGGVASAVCLRIQQLYQLDWN